MSTFCCAATGCRVRGRARECAQQLVRAAHACLGIGVHLGWAVLGARVEDGNIYMGIKTGVSCQQWFEMGGTGETDPHPVLKVEAIIP